MSLMLKVQDLGFERNEEPIFSRLHFNLHEGEIAQIVGANGSGKTTLLRVLCGLLPQTAGAICWCDHPVSTCRTTYVANLNYLGHQSAVKNELTVDENLKLFCALGHAQAIFDIADIKRKIGLEHKGAYYVKQLSSGQKRRLALARFFLLKTPLWLLDEPLTALDAEGKALIVSLFDSHLKAGGLILFSSHQVVTLPNISLQSIYL